MDDLSSSPAHESYELLYLDAPRCLFALDGENLTFTSPDGEYTPRVTLRRCFPLSAKHTNIMICAPDPESQRSQELGILANVDDLTDESRQAVMRELQLHYFVPVVRRIHKIKEEFGFLYWTVETDRGEKQFIMRDSIIGAVRRVSEGRWLIIDINQTRYEVQDFEALDANSQSLLQRYLLL